MKNKKNIIIGIALVLGGILLGWLIFGKNEKASENKISEISADTANATVWTCSMHPQIRQNQPGKCPICAMDLIPLSTGDDDNKEFDKIQMSESAMRIAEVQTTIVQKSVPVKEIRLSGKIKPDERKIAIITSHFDGRIEKLFINYTGQEVQKGEKLATVYSPELVTAQKELFEAIKLKQNNPEYYKAAHNKLKLWSLTNEQIDQIESDGEIQFNFDVVSYLNGTVLKREVTLGDHVEEGMKLFEIVDLANVWVVFDAYENDLPWIKVGDVISFEVQAVPGRIFKSKVNFIEAVINPETRVAAIRTETSNSEKLLKPDMFARGIFNARIDATKDALLIPKSAVLWTGKKAIVYVKQTGTAKPTFEYREIQLGEDAGGFYVVKNGLTEGEEVVTNGVFKIDAAAQLAGKKSMMNPEAGIAPLKHNHQEGMNMSAKDKETHLSEKKFSFKVYGNCEMCKERIEKAAKSVKGVLSADWNMDTKLLEVNLKDKTIKAEKISTMVAKAGHDTEFDTAQEDVYSTLPPCCQYERKK